MADANPSFLELAVKQVMDDIYQNIETTLFFSSQ